MTKQISQAIYVGILTLGLSLPVWAGPNAPHGKENHHHDVKKSYRKLVHTNKIAQQDIDSIEKKQKENRLYSKSASKGGLSQEEKEKIHANKAELEKMMAEAVAKAESSTSTGTAPMTDNTNKTTK